MKGKLKQKRKDGLRRQAQLMDIAMKIFSERGYHATSVEDIVSAAGIVKGTFYLHFESKQDLFDKIIDTNLTMLYESLKVLDISIPKPVEEIKSMYINVASDLMNKPEVRLFVRLGLREGITTNSGFLTKINSFFQSIIHFSAQYIKAAQEDGRIHDTIDPVIAAYSIVGAVKEVLFHWAVLDEKLDIEKTINSLVDIYFKGLIVEP